MAVNKNQLYRFKLIDKCLTDQFKKIWMRHEILEVFRENDINVSLRCLSKDIELMRYDATLGYFAPIGNCPKTKGYYYEDPNYSIERLPLTPSEFQTLATSLSLLKFKDAFKDFEAVIDKLIRIGEDRSRNIDTSAIIEFEKSPYYSGEKYIDPLVNYIREKQPIELIYQKFGQDQPSTYLVHPYYLKEYRNRWYLLCYYEAAGEMRTFALDRFVDFPVEKIVEYIPCPLKAPSDYFKDIIGVTLAKGPVEEIILDCDPSLAPYLKTQPLHTSQQTIEDTKSTFRIKLNLIPNYELNSTILSYGDKVRVIGK